MIDETTDVVCLTDTVVSKYVELSNQFTQDLSQVLIGPMWALFLAFAGFWIVIQGISLILVRTTLEDIAKEFIFVMIAAVLLSGQGPELVNNVYVASLSMMGSAASVALQVGDQSDVSATAVNGAVPLQAGMKNLVCTVEGGVKQVFGMASLIAKTGAALDPMPWAYALILVVPYFLILVVYFSLAVLSIFRIMMIAVLSPYLMLGFGFGWGRDMMKSGLRALIATFMVLFGGTAAVAVMLYAVKSLDIGDVTHEDVRAMASLYNEAFIVTLMMGWLGTAFMAEATGMTNTITNSSLTNTATGIITAGVTATAAAMTQNPATKALGATIGAGAAEASGNFAHNAAHGAGYAAGVVGGAAGYMSGQVGDLIQKMKKG